MYWRVARARESECSTTPYRYSAAQLVSEPANEWANGEVHREWAVRCSLSLSPRSPPLFFSRSSALLSAVNRSYLSLGCTLASRSPLLCRPSVHFCLVSGRRRTTRSCVHAYTIEKTQFVEQEKKRHDELVYQQVAWLDTTCCIHLWRHTMHAYILAPEFAI